jgi:hypothetical protein
MIKGQIIQLTLGRWLSNAAVGPLIAAGFVAMAVLLKTYAADVLTATAAG